MVFVIIIENDDDDDDDGESLGWMVIGENWSFGKGSFSDLWNNWSWFRVVV